MSAMPPGPRGLDVVRAALGRRRDPVALLMELKARHGDIVHVPVGDTHQFIVSDLAHVKHVFVDNHRNYTKGPGYEFIAGFLGRGLITSEGETWRRHRRAVQPVLERERLHGYMGVMIDAAGREAQSLAAAAAAGVGGRVDMYDAMMGLSLRIVSRSLLGADLGGREGELHAAVTVLLDHVEHLSASPLRALELLPGGSRLRGLRRLAASWPTARNQRARSALATLDALIHDIIQRRRREPSTGRGQADLVSLLLAEAPSAGEPALTDDEIRDEVMTLFLAGHETTATALTWCLHLLALHPEWRVRIADESAAVIGERAPSLDDMARLVAARQLFEEAMRLYPPVWRISRFAREKDRLGEYVVPAGSVVVVSPYLIHHDPAHWPDPERFDPTRFAGDAARGRSRLAFIPFGAGQRMCIGVAFATIQAQIILSAVCRAVRLDVEPGRPVSFEPRVTLRPRGGMPMRVTPLAARAAALRPSVS
ncbi:MAG: cytochrome P450 [Gemmatimonadaceae bacterium]